MNHYAHPDLSALRIAPGYQAGPHVLRSAGTPPGRTTGEEPQARGVIGRQRGGDGGIGCILLILWPVISDCIWLILWAVISVGEFVTRMKRQQQAPEPLLEPPDTLVVIMTCDRHRRYPRWYAWIMAIAIVAVVGAIAVILATVPNEKLPKAVGGSLFGLIVSFCLFAVFVRAPIRVLKNRDIVILTGLSDRYFSAPDGVQP